jgi:hypothetical protein
MVGRGRVLTLACVTILAGATISVAHAETPDDERRLLVDVVGGIAAPVGDRAWRGLINAGGTIGVRVGRDRRGRTHRGVENAGTLSFTGFGPDERGADFNLSRLLLTVSLRKVQRFGPIVFGARTAIGPQYLRARAALPAGRCTASAVGLGGAITVDLGVEVGPIAAGLAVGIAGFGHIPDDCLLTRFQAFEIPIELVVGARF